MSGLNDGLIFLGLIVFLISLGVGLYLLEQVGPLRRALMREGVDPLAARPRLMRGQALV